MTRVPVPADLYDAAATCRRGLEPLVDRDWSAPAGELAWDVRSTVAHVCDAVGWYALQLAVAGPARLRVDIRAHDDATNAELLDVLDAAAATLARVASAAPADARGYHTAGMADVTGFVAMGCDEILVHAWDACLGFGIGLLVAPDLAARVCRRLFPWAPGGVAPWPALLWANGRVELAAHARLGPDWVWHCAPLDEWDGTVPVWRGGSPGAVTPGGAAGARANSP